MVDDAMFSKILEDIREKRTRVAIIGLGYVGLPLAVEFARSGFRVCGFDVNADRVDAINRSQNYIADVPDDLLADLVRSEMLTATTEFSRLVDQDAISICVPTPLNKTGDPDLSFILQVLQEVKKHIRRGHIVVLESTTYPGTTEEILLPELQSSEFVVGKDFFLAFSPERIDPGNKRFGAKNTPKVIGGVTQACSQVATELYSKVIDQVVSVSSPRSAEMVKLLENTFRSINIGLVNELAIICNLLKIDVWEVIEAAATKPFGFMPFYPGPGLGGHCIPIDPSYLSWKLRTLNYRTRFIELARDINTAMPAYVVQKISDALNEAGKPVRGAKILVLGVSYKRDIDDIRESPALDIIRLLRERGGLVLYHDPYIPVFSSDGEELQSSELTSSLLKSQDCAVIVTDHSDLDYAMVVRNCPLVVDTRNATRDVPSSTARIVKL